MVTDDLAEEDFVRCDLFALSQLGLDESGGAELYAIAVPFSGRIRISSSYPHPIGIGIIGATRGGRALEDLPIRCDLQPMA